MWPLLVCLVVGLFFCVERWVTLLRANVDAPKFTGSILALLELGEIDQAVKHCQQTRGSLANVYLAGLLRCNLGVEKARTAIQTAGSIEVGFLERNLVWLGSIISVAPMFGFMGTIHGVMRAFDSIAAANDISPAVVASGIAEALMTTLFGLMVAIPVKVAHTWFVVKIDRIVADMEESSEQLLDAIAGRDG
jgi:biopolymer transport protein ExbB